MRHGVSCAKEPHSGGGYLHEAEDDTPYRFDGVEYCGRCHCSIDRGDVIETQPLDEALSELSSQCSLTIDMLNGLADSLGHIAPDASNRCRASADALDVARCAAMRTYNRTSPAAGQEGK